MTSLPSLSPALPSPEKIEQRKHAQGLRRAHRRAWIYKVLYGGVGHLVALLLNAFIVLLAFVTRFPGDDVDPWSLARLLIVVQVSAACLVNWTYHREAIHELRARERSIKY